MMMDRSPQEASKYEKRHLPPQFRSFDITPVLDKSRQSRYNKIQFDPVEDGYDLYLAVETSSESSIGPRIAELVPRDEGGFELFITRDISDDLLRKVDLDKFVKQVEAKMGVTIWRVDRLPKKEETDDQLQA